MSQSLARRAPFQLGRVTCTLAIAEALESRADEILGFLKRHAHGDWGEVASDERSQNDWAVKAGLRLLSRFETKKGKAVHIRTEPDRSLTTIFFQHEDYRLSF